MPKYFVSRQHYYYSQEYMVEIAIGGCDYAGADMLVDAYENEGEGQEYTDPREAADAAHRVLLVWALNSQDDPHITVVNTMGMGLEGESMSWEAVYQWANQTYEHLPKCDRDGCGKIIPGEPWKANDILDEEQFCSEYCANLAAEEEVRYQHQIWVEAMYQEYLALPFEEDHLKEEWNVLFLPDIDITWEVGTPREEIVRWFDDEYEDGFAGLRKTALPSP